MHKNPWGAILRGPIAFALSLSLIEVMLFSTPLEAQRSAYVTNINSNTVSVIDTLTDTVTATIAVGTQPAGVVVTPDGAHVYVANFVDNTVSVIATATNTVVATVPAGTAPFAIAITPDGARVYVGNAGSGTVSVIATATNTVVAPVVVGGEPRGVAITPDGTRAYIANDVSNSVSVINTATNTVVATVPAGTAPFAVAITPDGTRAYVANDFSNNVSVIDTATNTVVATVPVGSRPFGVAITPDGARAYVTNRDAGTASLIATATNTVVGTIYAGAIPFGIAITPDGAHAYVTNMAINTVSVIATATNAVVATVRVGTPFGVAITPSAATPSDPTPPVITPNVSGTLGLNGWYTSSVNLTWSVSDPESGISSTQNCGPREFTDESGLIVRCIATNGAGLSNRVEVTIKIDRDPPVISGMPPAGCALGPPDDRLVTVATVFGFDIRSGVASFDLTVTSNEPSDPADIIITKSGDQARTLQLRLKRDRTYTIAATETDSAGNPVRATTTCTVPRKRGAAPPSTFTKIDFPGAIQTQLFSINNRGQIVGAYTDTNNVSHGFLLDNGTFTTLDVFPRGINDRGQMVGSYGGHGFILDHGVFTTFDFPSPHAVQTEGSAINNLGQITGRYWHRYNISGSGPAPSYPTPYLLDHGVGTSFIDKGFSDTVRVFGLNDRAQIVGEDTGRAFLLDNGTVTRLPGYSFSDINNRGQIVGTQAGVHPFLLDNGTFIMIDFPGTGTTQSPVFLPSGINDRGQIVGSLFASDNRNGQSYHGFLLSNNSSENGNGDDHGNNNKDHENNGNQK